MSGKTYLDPILVITSILYFCACSGTVPVNPSGQKLVQKKVGSGDANADTAYDNSKRDDDSDPIETFPGSKNGDPIAEDEDLDQPKDETQFCIDDSPKDFNKAGNFSVKKQKRGSVNIYEPQDIPSGCRVPIVHLSNGTGATCSYYGSILQHLASHGFLAACYESTSTGSGKPCMNSLETLLDEYSDIAANKIGTTGHSQGGGAAITCGYLAEQKWGEKMQIAIHAIEPAHGMSRSSWKSEYPKIKSPTFMLSGSADTIVPASWVGQGYEVLNSPTYWYIANGATHMNAQPWAAESALAWFRWQLLNDEAAKEKILSLDSDSRWRFKEKKQVDKIEKFRS
tara:strand:+ start:246 stop:1265 length:1020 start_codon:yes stop_codon:yes gene_type:complete